MTATIEDARHHVHHLRDAGMRMKDIAHSAAITPRSLSKIMSGQSDGSPRTISMLMATTPTSRRRDGRNIPSGTAERVLEEWPHMLGLLGEQGAVARLADAFTLAPATIRTIVGLS